MRIAALGARERRLAEGETRAPATSSRVTVISGVDGALLFPGEAEDDTARLHDLEIDAVRPVVLALRRADTAAPGAPSRKSAVIAGTVEVLRAPPAHQVFGCGPGLEDEVGGASKTRVMVSDLFLRRRGIMIFSLAVGRTRFSRDPIFRCLQLMKIAVEPVELPSRSGGSARPNRRFP